MTETEREWLKANSPGGWIDDLRKRAEAAEALLREAWSRVPFSDSNADIDRRIEAFLSTPTGKEQPR